MADPDKVVEAVAFSRRSFVKKLVATGFAIPVISSFALDIGSAHGTVPHGHDNAGNNGLNDIFIGNMTLGNEHEPFCREPHGHANACTEPGIG
jgi:hypothetical protein